MGSPVLHMCAVRHVDTGDAYIEGHITVERKTKEVCQLYVTLFGWRHRI